MLASRYGHSATCLDIPYRVDKNHIATSVVKAEERREEKLGDSLLDEMRFGESRTVSFYGPVKCAELSGVFLE